MVQAYRSRRKLIDGLASVDMIVFFKVVLHEVIQLFSVVGEL